jgi:fido (protein-threonine AMPylation protein)
MSSGMNPPDCPEFEYDEHPQRSSLLKSVREILLDLRSGKLLIAVLVRDTRPSHRSMFNELTPPGCDYYAGNYRGSSFRCLRYYAVAIKDDPRVGEHPQLVAQSMMELERRIDSLLSALDTYCAVPGVQDHEKLLAAVSVVCDIFDIFLAIHPYANGNGHMARLIVCALLGRQGYWPHGWTIEPRPADPPYTGLLVQHRNGNRAPLQQWILGLVNSPMVTAP